MKVLIMSDIHGNRAALQAVLDNTKKETNIQACILLGDMIDYGMHTNEVINMVKGLPYPILCNIWGNHENAVSTNLYDRFSSDRGRECAKYTRSVLTEDSWNYILKIMTCRGSAEFTCGSKRCLAVHGSLEDQYWSSIKPDQELNGYQNYDYVFSGHSHLPHFFEKYYQAEDIRRRNKRKVIFINPGSVGQPRNLNPMAQYAILDMETERVTFEKVTYDIKEEQRAYHRQVDDFYRERLEVGV